jgi:hypothetical protein
MDKIQLLSIMREQELEIERLSAEINNQHGQDLEVERLTAELSNKRGQDLEVERLKAELNSKRGQDLEIERLKSELNSLRMQEPKVERLTSSELNLMREQELEIERLTAEKDELVKRLEASRFTADNAGSLAEASLSVSGIMQSAQEAANVYLNNIKRLEEEKKATIGKVEDEARLKAAAILREAELRRDELENIERKNVEELRKASQMYMNLIDTVHAALHDMIDRYKLTQLTKLKEPLQIFSGDHNE